MPFDSTNVTKPEVSALLQLREKIADGRWIQGQYSSILGGHCLVGWIFENGRGAFAAANRIEENQPIIDLLSKRIRKPPTVGSDAWLDLTPVCRLEHWNDEMTRRKRDVLRLIDRTLAKIL